MYSVFDKHTRREETAALRVTMNVLFISNRTASRASSPVLILPVQRRESR